MKAPRATGSDTKITPLVETFNAEMLDAYAQACGSGYLGSSNDAFDTVMGKFALAYADQAERDHAALKAAVCERSLDLNQHIKSAFGRFTQSLGGRLRRLS